MYSRLPIILPVINDMYVDKIVWSNLMDGYFKVYSEQSDMQ